MRIDIPTNAQLVIGALESAGFEAYVVGGCVRDAIMGRQPNDWDICTSALPEQTKATCQEAGFATFDTGIQHGTITVHVNHEPFEVTTYRSDGTYSDGRHPDRVTFLNSVSGDLLRRDFTVNAMAYHPQRGLVDVSGGREDLSAKVLRCVGDPHERFAEDGLRIIRALRFASVLGFEIEPRTAAAIHEDKDLLRPVAMERISAEFLKLICGPGAASILMEYRDVVAVFIPQVEPMFDHDQLTPYHIYDVWEHSVRTCAAIEPEPALRLAALIHDVGKPDCFFTDDNGVGHFYSHPRVGEPIAREICRNLKLPNTTTDFVSRLVRHHDRSIPVKRKAMRRMLAELGEDFVRELYKIMEADKLTHSTLKQEENMATIAFSRQLMEEVLKDMDVLSESDLSLNGRDLIQLGFEPGPQLGEVKKQLFQLVVDEELPNTRESLTAYAATLLPQQN